ncbi:MAG: hypothetical protein JWO58_151 [Chitinophagaceae bacterium]|nr:hypothetical protein [Chitinophagaceae bacterium]
MATITWQYEGNDIEESNPFIQNNTHLIKLRDSLLNDELIKSEDGTIGINIVTQRGDCVFQPSGFSNTVVERISSYQK